MKKNYSFLSVLLLTLFCALPAKSQIYTIESDYSPYSDLFITSISPNGKYVGGYVGSFAALLWTEEEGVKIIRSELGQARAKAVNDNGVIAGQFTDPDVIYTPSWGADPYPILSAGYYKDEQWHGLGVLKDPETDFYGSKTQGISADGTIIGGSMHVEESVWQPTIWRNGVPEALEFEAVATGASVLGLSADGRVAAGCRSIEYDWYQPVVWIDGNMRLITHNGEEIYGQCGKVSPNGKYVAVTTARTAGVYDVEADQLFLVEKEDEGDTDNATAVSDEGVLIGYSRKIISNQDVPRTPFIFTEKMGRYNLNEYLAELGMTEAMDADFSTPTAISADGLKIAGSTKSYVYIPKGWVVKLDHHLKGLYPASDLKALETPSGQIDLQWTAPKADAENTYTGYEIYRNGELIATVGKEENTFTETGLPYGIYTYKVVALYNTDEKARASNEVRVATALVDLPFVEDFTSLSLDDNYWNITEGSDYRWFITQSNGKEDPYITYMSEKKYVTESLISPYIDTTNAEDLYLSYSICVPHTWNGETSKEVFKVELYDGVAWTTIKEYVPNESFGRQFVFEKFDISEAIGAEIRIRFSVTTSDDRANNFLWEFRNIKVFESKDDWVKESPICFTAHKMDDGTVHLNWTDPGNHATLAYAKQDQLVFYNFSSSPEDTPSIGAIKYEPEELLCYSGFEITSVSAALGQYSFMDGKTIHNIVIYEGSEKVYEQLVETPVYNAWHEYSLDNPYVIKSGYEQPLYIGIEAVGVNINIISLGFHTREPANGEGDEFEGQCNLFSDDGGETWLNLREISGELTGGIPIKAYLNNPAEHQTPRLIGFMAYEEGEPLLIDQQSGEMQYTKLYTHTVLHPKEDATCYQVAAVYDTLETSDMKEFCLGDEVVVNIVTVKGEKDLYTVYPNPVEHTLNISGDFTRLTLMNINGGVILKSSENGINVSNLPTGVYFLMIESDKNAPVVKKIIKR